MRPPPSLPGRDTDLSQLLEALRLHRAAECHAPCGSGRTALASAVAAHARDVGRQEVAVVRAELTPADTLRALAERLVPGLPDRSLDGAAAVVRQRLDLLVVDDVTWAAPECRRLLRLLRGCALLLVGERAMLSPEVMSLRLAGLPFDAATAVVAGQVHRPLTAEEQADLARLTRHVVGRPLSLRQAGVLVAAGRASLADLAAAVGRDPRALDRMTSGRLSAGGRRLVGALALTAGALLPAELLDLLGDVQDVRTALQALADDGVVEERDDRYGLPVCRAEAFLDPADLVEVGRVARAVVEWLTGHGSAPSGVDVADAALPLARHAAAAQDWHTVVLLTDVAEPVLNLAGKLDTAGELLRLRALATTYGGDPHPGAAAGTRHDDRPSWRERMRWTRRTAGRAGLLAVVVAGSVAVGQLIPWAGADDAPRPGASTSPPDPTPSTSTPSEPTSPPSSPPVVPPPRIVAPAGVRREATGPRGAVVRFVVTATDARGRRVRPRCSPASGARFPVRRTTVTCTATDRGGRTSSTSFPVRVVDTRGPVVTVDRSTFEATGRDGAVVTYRVSAVDAVSGRSAPSCDGPVSGTTLALGDHLLVCTARDAGGRRTTQRFTLSVVDTTPPELTVPPDQVVPATKAPVMTGLAARDLVDGDVRPTCTPDPAAPITVTTEYRCTATDGHGNTARGRFTATVPQVT